MHCIGLCVKGAPFVETVERALKYFHFLSGNGSSGSNMHDCRIPHFPLLFMPCLCITDMADVYIFIYLLLNVLPAI